MSPVAVAPKIGLLAQATDFKAAVLKELGDLNDIELFFNQILIASYIRPEKTKGGIWRPGSNVEEDAYQDKIGMVIAKGPQAFKDDDNFKFDNQNVELGDYLLYRPGDGFPITHNGVPCRMLTDRLIKGRVKHPERTI